MASDVLDEWLCTELSKLNLDHDIYGEYVKGIMSDNDVELDERIENVMQILSGATDKVSSAYGVQCVLSNNNRCKL